MNIVSISGEFIELCSSGDREFMIGHGRPCIIVGMLRFRGKRRDFAVPFRSSIAPNVPKDQYFPLPPRPSTRARHRHGVHYIKIFSIKKRHARLFRIEGNEYYRNIQGTIGSHTKDVVNACQRYLDRYETCGRPRFVVDVDRIIGLLDQQERLVLTKWGLRI